MSECFKEFINIKSVGGKLLSDVSSLDSCKTSCLEDCCAAVAWVSETIIPFYKHPKCKILTKKHLEMSKKVNPSFDKRRFPTHYQYRRIPCPSADCSDQGEDIVGHYSIHFR